MALWALWALHCWDRNVLRIGQNAAPLEVVARQFRIPEGAVSAMAGVLLNLILGLSRVVLAMGRRRDLPSIFAHVERSAANPFPAVILVAVLICVLVLTGEVKTTWSFSAFTVLIYYAITYPAAIQLTDDQRRNPCIIRWLSLFACVFPAFWGEPLIWKIGMGLIGFGLIGTGRREG